MGARATSRQAWDEVKETSAPRRKEAVWAYMTENARPEGFTGAELDKALGPDAHKRLADLVKDGGARFLKKPRPGETSGKLNQAAVALPKPWIPKEEAENAPTYDELVDVCRALHRLLDRFPASYEPAVRAKATAVLHRIPIPF